VIDGWCLVIDGWCEQALAARFSKVYVDTHSLKAQTAV
jgi:hypothetical protein